MNDEDKTRQHLLAELVELRRRFAERTRMEAALQTSETKYRQLHQSMRDAFVSVSLEGQILEFNDAYRQMLGYEQEELLRRKFTDLTPEKWHPVEAQIVREHVLPRGYSDIYEKEYRRKDGTVFPVELRTCLISSEDGLPVAMWAIVRDISERKRLQRELRESKEHLEQRILDRMAELTKANEDLQAEVAQRRLTEQALRESKQRMQMSLDVSRSFSFEWEVTTDRVWRSESCSRVLGLFGDEAVHDTGQRFFRRIHHEDRERFVGMLRGVKPSADTYRTEYRVIRGGGTTAVLEESARGFFDGEGALRRLVGVTTDITERKRAEESLRRSEARYRAIVESCPDCVVMVDLSGRIVLASQRAAEQHDFADPGVLIGMQAIDFVVESDRDRFRASIGQLPEEGVHRNVEYQFLRRDGSTFDVELSSTVIRDAQGKPEALMAVYRDISERKRTAEKLRRKDADLFAAAEIQQHLLPQESPQLSGFDIAGRCYPAEAAAGDHFDFLPRPDGSLLLVLGDVSGHGIGPAILAADFCARLRTLSESADELPEIAQKVNQGLCRDTALDAFVTAILGRLDPYSRNVTCLNAGHPPGIVLNSAGEVKARLSSGGFPFAIVANTPYVATDASQLADGDIVFLYTDGIVEAGRREQSPFGLQRAILIIQANRHRTAAEIIEALHLAACQYAGTDRLEDDMTLIIMKVLGPQQPYQCEP